MTSLIHTRRQKYNRAFVRRMAGDSLKFLMMPFRSRFCHDLYRLEQMSDGRSLDQLRGFGEMYQSAWFGLEQLGYEIVRQFQPQVIVELGTHMGLSALAMGLGLRNLDAGGQLFAVDTWEGESHAGKYDDSVYQTFLERRASLGLESTIVPLRMRFDEALHKVTRPIDLLHIDGLHTHEAVSHDWETYSPLVSPGGLVLFHDVNSPWRDVAAFWKQLTKRYETYTVYHSNGLGILRMPS